MCFALKFNVRQLYEQMASSHIYSKRNSVPFVSLWLNGRYKMFSNCKTILALIFKVDKAKRKFVI